MSKIIKEILNERAKGDIKYDEDEEIFAVVQKLKKIGFLSTWSNVEVSAYTNMGYKVLRIVVKNAGLTVLKKNLLALAKMSEVESMTFTKEGIQILLSK